MATPPSNDFDRRILGSVRPAVRLALSVVVAIASAVLILWFVPGLDALAPSGWSKMTANAAVALFLAGCSVLMLTEAPTKGIWPARIAAFLVLTIGVLTLAEYLTHHIFGIDIWLPHSHIVQYPGRPSPPTSIGLVLIGTTLLARDKDDAQRSLIADSATLLLIAVILVQICSQIYGALALRGLNKVTIMSPHTLICFSCITFAIVMGRAEQGNFLAVLMGAGIGSRIVRIALPAGILLPLVVFTIEATTIKTGFASVPVALAIVASAESFGILCLVTWMGTRINLLEQELKHVSLTDELTKVYNRRGFYVLGHQAVLDAGRADTGLTLFFFDLDGLKRVNDMLGHEAGSDMIRAFATELVSRFRKSDIVGRLGGDEFAVLTIRDQGISYQDILTQLEHSAACFSSADARLLPLRFSAGHTQLIRGGSDSLEAMVDRADALMYLDKEKRKRLKEEPGSLPVDPAAAEITRPFSLGRSMAGSAG
jgi:diguanylate cyclase (GGDEF)-like protein